MRRILLACTLSCASIQTSSAQNAIDAASPTPASVQDLDTVVVHGVQPGPGLWKVSKGDHVLWILGTLSPLPKDISWDSKRVEILIASSQEIVTGTDVRLKSTAGLFGDLAALPALVGVRDNPDGKMLKDVVPADQYARWLPLKAKYIGASNRVEAWRPIFAALELYDAAIDKTGLTDKQIAQDVVERAARHAGVKITTPTIEVTADHPRAAVKEFKATGVDDTDCFRKTLDRIDSDLGTMTSRANAWSTGDLDALRKLSWNDQMAACAQALSQARLAQTHGMEAMGAHARQVWLDAAAHALDNNQVSFAMLPIARLLRSEGGYLAGLRERGYTVEEPASKELPAPPATTASPR